MIHQLHNIEVSLLADAVIMIDNRERIVLWNEAATRMLIYTAGEALGADLGELIGSKRYKGKYKQVFREFRSTGDRACNNTIELMAMRKDQIEITVELSLSSVIIADKWHAICLLRDISARKQIEQDLWCANQALKAKVAELTQDLHAVNQQLAVVNAEVTALKEKLRCAISEKEQEILLRQHAEQELLAKTEELERFFC